MPLDPWSERAYKAGRMHMVAIIIRIICPAL